MPPPLAQATAPVVLPSVSSVSSMALLSLNTVAVVTTNSGVVTKPARLRSLGWIDTKITGAHAVEKVPNLRDHLRADRLPVVVSKNRIARAQMQIVQLARALHAFVATVLRTTNDVV